MHDLKTRTESRIAYCQSPDEPGGDGQAGFTIHGVALAPDEVNRGAVNGEPTAFTLSDEVLSEAAASLEGQPIIDVHSDGGDGRIEYPPPADITVGKVTKAGHEPGVGVLYEAVIADEELATKIEAGILDVSPELGLEFAAMDEEPFEVSEAMFAGLAIVSLGGAPSNSAAAGPNEALATLSVAGINAMLAATGTDDGGTTPSPDGEMPEAPDGSGGGGGSTVTGTEPADSGADSENTTTMGDNPNDDPDVDALLERLDEKEERIDDLEASNDDLTDKNATLSERNETLEAEIGEVKQGYAAVLAEEGPFDEEDLVENFDIATLRERFEDRFEDGFAATLSEPDVQSGADPDGGDGPNDLSPDEEEEVAQLKQRVEYWDGKNATIAQAEKDRLAETLGVESYDEVDLEAI